MTRGIGYSVDGDVRDAMKEFFELQIQQNGVVLDLAAAHLHTAECLATYVKHNEDPHAGFVLVDHLTQRLTVAQQDEHSRHIKFDANQTRLTELKDVIIYGKD